MANGYLKGSHKGLTLRMSALNFLTVANLHYQCSWYYKNYCVSKGVWFLILATQASEVSWGFHCLSQLHQGLIFVVFIFLQDPAMWILSFSLQTEHMKTTLFMFTATYNMLFYLIILIMFHSYTTCEGGLVVT